jgi:cytochrome c-type biogenesis protein
LAVSSGTVLQAGVLLLTYSIGLSIPFLAMGAAYGAVSPWYSKAKRHIWIVNYLSGAMLIVIGILIYTDSLINLNELFNFGFLQDISSET